LNKSSEKNNYVKKDILTSNIEQMLGEYINKCKIETKTSFHPSQVTECPRRIVYRSQSHVAENFGILNLEDNNLCIKNKWIERIKKINKINVLYTDLLASDCTYNLVTIIHAILNISGELFTLHIQPVTQDNFQNIQKKGANRKHVIEVMTNMWLAETKHGLLIYENKNDNNFLLFHIIEYPEIVKSIKNKCKMMSEYKIKGKLPRKPYDMKSLECDICEYKQKCWKE